MRLARSTGAPVAARVARCVGAGSADAGAQSPGVCWARFSCLVGWRCCSPVRLTGTARGGERLAGAAAADDGHPQLRAAADPVRGRPPRGRSRRCSRASRCWRRQPASSATPGRWPAGGWSWSSTERCARRTSRCRRRCGAGAQSTAGEQIGMLQAGHPGCPVAGVPALGAAARRDLPGSAEHAGRSGRYGCSRRRGRSRRCRPREQVRATTVSSAGAAARRSTRGVTWSVAAVAGAGVVMVRRRR